MAPQTTTSSSCLKKINKQKSSPICLAAIHEVLVLKSARASFTTPLIRVHVRGKRGLPKNKDVEGRWPIATRGRFYCPISDENVGRPAFLSANRRRPRTSRRMGLLRTRGGVCIAHETTHSPNRFRPDFRQAGGLATTARSDRKLNEIIKNLKQTVFFVCFSVLCRLITQSKSRFIVTAMNGKHRYLQRGGGGGAN